MELIPQMSFEQFVTHDFSSLEGWIWMQEDPEIGLVTAESLCTITDYSMSTKQQETAMDALLESQGFISTIEPWDFFGHLKDLPVEAGLTFTATALRHINHLIAHDCWPFEEDL